MGGDHKCPVCQATFTRPQHVARHMRSHTGDRPYKCQFCGDQFARSDLLSRHINKCHANEKPAPVQGRRKGSASASRATTSKQACDQCVQSSLPCDGSNPCVKCVQRKCRCTYVKFHRQTAPVGPGHNPRPTVPVIPPNAAAISSRLPLSYPSDDFFLQPPPSGAVADPLYSSHTFSFPSLYPDPASSQDFTSKYRAQAELLRNGTPAAAVSGHAHFAPAGGGGTVGPGISPLSSSHMYNDPRSTPGASWVPWGQETANAYHHQDPLHDKDIHRGHDPLSHRSQHQSYLNSQAIPHPLQQSSSSGAGTSYSHQLQSSAPYLRRGSVEFGSSSEGSHGSPTTAEHSIPSSAASSNVHLPLDNLTMQQPHSLSYNALDNLSDHHPNYSAQVAAASRHDQANGLQSSAFRRGEPVVSPSVFLHDPNPLVGLTNANTAANSGGGGATSFFPGMMNLEGGDDISSLSQVPADDPDATPMPLKENPPPNGQLSAPPVAMSIPMRSSSTGGSAAGTAGGNNLFINPNGNGEPKEFRDFWKQYVRTPLSAPDAAGGVPLSSPPSSSFIGGGLMSPPAMTSRRQRVASMPSSKTPAIAMSLQSAHLQQHQQRQNDRASGSGESSVRTTLHDDLKSYEAAVMARKAPTNLNLVPKIRRGTAPALPPSPSSATGFGGVQGVGVPPPIKFDTLLHQHQQQFQYSPHDPRPSSSSTNESGSSGDRGSPFSLTGAYMRHQQHPPLSLSQGQQIQSPNLSGTQFLTRRGSPSNSSTSTTGGESSSRASSVSAADEGPDDQDGNNNSDDGYGGAVSGGKAARRPSYKRLASTILGPVKAKKRASELKVGSSMAVRGEEDTLESPTSDLDVTQGFASGALGIH